VLKEGELLRNPELGDALLLARHYGGGPSIEATFATAGVRLVWGLRGGALSGENLAGYRAVERAPVNVRYRDRECSATRRPRPGGRCLPMHWRCGSRLRTATLCGVVEAMRGRTGAAHARVRGRA